MTVESFITVVVMGCRGHSHKKRKDSLEGSLYRLLFAAEHEFPKILPRLPQHTSDVKIECVGQVSMVKTTVLFIYDQLLGAPIHFNFIIFILICFWLMMLGVNYIILGYSPARTTPEVSLYRSLTREKNITAVITQNRVINGNLESQIKNQTLCPCRLFLLN